MHLTNVLVGWQSFDPHLHRSTILSKAQQSKVIENTDRQDASVTIVLCIKKE
jgi:hypothetical protein